MPLLCASFSVAAAASPPEIATPAVFFKKKKTAKSVKASLDIFKKNLLCFISKAERRRERERERERVNEKIFFWSKPKRKGNEVKESF